MANEALFVRAEPLSASYAGENVHPVMPCSSNADLIRSVTTITLVGV